MKRSKITELPREVKTWLDQALVAGNFAGYKLLEEELKKRGHQIGKSSIWRYGTNLESKLAAIRASTEAAKIIAESAPDDAGQLSGAVMSMIQTEVFNVLVTLQEIEQSGASEKDDAAAKMARAKLLSQLAKNVATLSRASVSQKKHEIEIRGKVAAAADRAAAVAKKGGLTKGAVDSIRREILGIAG
jgi:O-phosphoseryl-tRNA(Cys) synthetase